MFEPLDMEVDCYLVEGTQLTLVQAQLGSPVLRSLTKLWNFCDHAGSHMRIK